MTENPTVSAKNPPSEARLHARAVPWQIWVVVATLGLEGIGNLVDIPSNLIAAQWLTTKVVLILGLIRAWRWAYVVTMVLACLHVLTFAPISPVAALINLALVVLVASTRRYFFPNRNDSPTPVGKPKSMTDPIARDLEF